MPNTEVDEVVLEPLNLCTAVIQTGDDKLIHCTLAAGHLGLHDFPTSASEVKLGDLIEPTPGRLAVEVNVKEERTKSGLFIPRDTTRSQHEQKATQGIVVALGDEDEDDLENPPSKIKLGDTVLFGKYSGTEVLYQPDRTKDPQKVFILNVRDILAVLRSPEEAANIRITR